MKKLLMAAGVALLIAGCGGGGSSGADSGTVGEAGSGGPSGGMQTGSGDTFIAGLLSLIGSTSEEAEPVSVESLNATTPEDTAPVPLG